MALDSNCEPRNTPAYNFPASDTTELVTHTNFLPGCTPPWASAALRDPAMNLDTNLSYAADDPFPQWMPLDTALYSAPNAATPRPPEGIEQDAAVADVASTGIPASLAYPPPSMPSTPVSSSVLMRQSSNASLSTAMSFPTPPLGQAHSPSPVSSFASPTPSISDDVENYRWDCNDEGGKFRVQCPRCDKWIRTGSLKQNLGPLKGHMSSTRGCRRATTTAQDEVIAATYAARNALFPTSRVTTPARAISVRSEAPLRVTSGPPVSNDLSAHADLGKLQEDVPPLISPVDSRIIEFDVTTPETYLAKYANDPTDESDAEMLLLEAVPRGQDGEALSDCPGLVLRWPKDPFFETYPFQRHAAGGPRLGYYFCAVDKKGSRFRVRSDKCTRRALDSGETPCTPCQTVSATLDHLASLSSEAPPRTSHKLLTHEQLVRRLRAAEEEVNRLKLKGLNEGRKCAVALRQLEDSKRFVISIAENDAPRLRQLVRQGMKDRSSIAAITRKVEMAATGLYKARGYEQIDYDIALLILRCGGRSLLWSMSEHSILPSVRTLKRENIFTRIVPSCGMPTYEEIVYNIEEVFGNKRESLRRTHVVITPSGMTACWDELNIEDMACHVHELDCVGGLCREHVGSVKRRIDTYEDAEAIARALADGDVHYGSECSVIALSSFSTVVRSALPIVVSPTCKREHPKESAVIIRRVIDAWNKTGAAEFGPIWSFASDGDAGRRQMVYDVFMTETIHSQHALYKYVGRLPGLNLRIGAGDITGDFDWKHEIKRMMRLLLTQEGVTLGNMALNVDTVKQHLRRDPSLSDTEIYNLTKPTDTQDVPRAVRFLQQLGHISELSSNGCNPSELKEVEFLSVIAEMFLAFTHAFIRVEWSLTEQVVSLSKYAHMAFILYREHGQNIMPHQLYGDTQCTVKNAIICIAKQQEADGDRPFYLFWLGDDRLEGLFGIVRMLGGHDPNFTFVQLVDRFGAALDIDAVYTRHPELNPGHRRLKVTTAEHADHLNPESWLGDATAKNVNLESAWLKGREQALVALHRLGLSPDFRQLFDPERKVDMLMPWGGNKYVGVSQEADRSVEPWETEAVPTESGSTPPPLASSHWSASDERDDGLFIISSEEDPLPDRQDDEPQPEASPHISRSESQSVSRPLTAPDNQRTTTCPSPGDNSESIALQDAYLSFEEAVGLDVIPNTSSTRRRPPFAPASPSPWIIYKGKKIHKATLCRLVITPDHIRKSHERLLRVRNYSCNGKARPALADSLSSDQVLGDAAFVLGDLFVSLLRCDDTVSLAVLKAIRIEEKGVHMEQIDWRKLRHPSSQIKLTGQVLEMKNIHGLKSSEEMEDEDGVSHPSNHWLWTGNFVKLDLNQHNSTAPSPTSKAVRKTLAIKVPGHVCKPINPRIYDLTSWLRDTGSSLPHLNSFSQTWELTESELSLTADSLWATVKSHNSMSTIPAFRSNATFPYKNIDGHVSLVSDQATAFFKQEAARSTEKFQCYMCLIDMEPTRARPHVGEHILKSIRGVHEELRGEEVGHPLPCGFCGRVGLEGCSQLFLTKTSQARSGCRHTHKFLYRPALDSTETTKSTNVPIICTIPGCKSAVRENDLSGAIWKYNMPEHIRTAHPEYSLDGSDPDAVPLPADLALAIAISREEEERIGIPKDKIPRNAMPEEDLRARRAALQITRTSRSRKRSCARSQPETTSTLPLKRFRTA